MGIDGFTVRGYQLYVHAYGKCARPADGRTASHCGHARPLLRRQVPLFRECAWDARRVIEETGS